MCIRDRAWLLAVGLGLAAFAPIAAQADMPSSGVPFKQALKLYEPGPQPAGAEGAIAERLERWRKLKAERQAAEPEKK